MVVGVLGIAGYAWAASAQPAPAPVTFARGTVALLEIHQVPDTGVVSAPVTLCSGVPIAGTDLVATAAHCVATAEPGQELAIHWGNRVWTAVEVAWDPGYESPHPAHDAGVVKVAPVHDTRIGDTPGAKPLAEVAFDLPQQVFSATVLAMQYPPGLARTTRATVSTCSVRAGTVVVADDHWRVPCNLQKGASGGPVVDDASGALLGVVATISDDGTNGIAPLASLYVALGDAARKQTITPAT